MYEGQGEIRADGSATIELAQTFLGQAAMGLRAGLEQLPPAQLHDAIEGKLLAQAIPGARLGKVTVDNQGDLDRPIVMRMSIQVSDFARRRGRDLVLAPPFPIRISQVARLPRRQTPLLLGEPTYASVKLSFNLPKGAKVLSRLDAGRHQGSRAQGLGARSPGRANARARAHHRHPRRTHRADRLSDVASVRAPGRRGDDARDRHRRRRVAAGPRQGPLVTPRASTSRARR